MAFLFSKVVELRELFMKERRPGLLVPRSPLAFGRYLASRHPAALIVVVRAVGAVVLVAGVATVTRVMFALSWQTDSAIAALVAAGWVAFTDLRDPGM
jgi:hypothetical protein